MIYRILFTVLSTLLLVVLIGCSRRITGPTEDYNAKAPSTFCLTQVSEKVIQIKWGGGNANIFRIERTIMDNNSYQEVGSTSESFFIDYNMDSTKTYLYRIRAILESDTNLSNPIKLSYTSSNILLREIKTNYPINRMILSPNGKYLVFLDDGKSINLINTSNWSIQRYSNDNIYCESIAFTPNSQNIVSGETSKIKFRSITDGNIFQIINTDSSYVLGLALTNDGNQLVSSEMKRYVYKLRLWDSNSGQIIRTIDSTFIADRNLVIRPDSNQLIACSNNGLRVWNISNGALLYQNQNNYYSPPVVSHDGSMLGVRGNSIEYFRTSDWTLMYSTASNGPFDFSSVNLIQIMGNDARLKIVNIADGMILRTIYAHTDYINAIQLFPDNKTFATGSYDGIIKIWSTELTRQWTIISE